MICQPQGKIDCFGVSRKHPRFQRNSDRFLIADLRPSLRIHSSDSLENQESNLFGESQGQLLVIADGVGERQSAVRASALAVDTFNSHLLGAVTVPNVDSDFDEPDLFEEFALAVDECRDVMKREVAAADRFEAMGAVMTLVYIRWPSAYIMHVGNNRAYHWQSQSVDQVTKDHTMARRLVDAGQLSPKRAKQSDLRNVVWNLIGTQTDETNPDFDEISLSVGDAIVLCSDGVTESLGQAQITEALENATSAEQTCKQLMADAERAGLNDDATIVVAKFADRASSQQLEAAQEQALPGDEKELANLPSQESKVKALQS